MNDEARAVYAARFNARAIERPRRPAPVAPYVRPTDDDLAALPPHLYSAARRTRDMWDAMAPIRAMMENLNETCRQMVERQTTQRDVAAMEGP